MHNSYIEFHHLVPFCGARFQSKVDFMRDFPERVICPACPGSNQEGRAAAIKRLASAIAEFQDAKADLEKRFNLRILNLSI